MMLHSLTLTLKGVIIIASTTKNQKFILVLGEFHFDERKKKRRNV